MGLWGQPESSGMIRIPVKKGFAGQQVIEHWRVPLCACDGDGPPLESLCGGIEKPHLIGHLDHADNLFGSRIAFYRPVGPWGRQKIRGTSLNGEIDCSGIMISHERLGSGNCIVHGGRA